MKTQQERDLKSWKEIAIESAEFIKSRNPPNEVAVKDLDSGELTVVAYKPLHDGALTAAHKKLPFGSRVRVTAKRIEAGSDFGS
jgi:hypothetical protein